MSIKFLLEERTAIINSGTLHALTEVEWDSLLLFVRRRSLEAGEVLYTIADAGDSMAIVLSGSLSVRVPSSRLGSREIARSEAGDLVGEMACIDPAPRSATVVALVPTQLMVIDRTSLLVMSQHLPRVASQITGAIIRRANAKLTQIDEQFERAIGAPRRPSERPAPPRTPSAPPPSTASKGSLWRGLFDRIRGAG